MASNSSDPRLDDALNRLLRVLLADHEGGRLGTAEGYREQFP